jgi:P27 family predicted phage terminase small subunit
VRGRKPKPTALKLLQGNPGKRSLNGREPRPEVVAPDRPDWLSPAAAAEWERVVPELLALGLLTRLDRAALCAYCQAYAELQRATEMIEAEGLILDVEVFNRAGDVTGTVRKPHPAVRLQRDAFHRVKAFLCEFGLTPSSRTRLRTPEAPAESDPIAELMRRAKGNGKAN